MTTRRILITMAAGLVALLLVAGTAVAQITLRAEPLFDPPVGEVEELPSVSPRKNFPMTVDVEITVQGQGFVCAQPTSFIVTVIQPPQFPPWAGMSLNPEPLNARFTIPAGNHGGGWNPPPAGSANFEAAWDEDGPINGTYTYSVPVGSVSIAGDSQDACIPNFSGHTQDYKEAQITLFRPWSPEYEEANRVPCDIDPSQPRCVQDDEPLGGDSPGLNVALLLMAAIGSVLVFRRRRVGDA